MKKRAARRARHHHTKRIHAEPQYWIIVRGWMFVVAFALMLGMGAVLGNFFKTQLDTTTPQVAGAQIEAR